MQSDWNFDWRWFGFKAGKPDLKQKTKVPGRDRAYPSWALRWRRQVRWGRTRRQKPNSARALPGGWYTLKDPPKRFSRVVFPPVWWWCWWWLRGRARPRPRGSPWSLALEVGSWSSGSRWGRRSRRWLEPEKVKVNGDILLGYFNTAKG